MQEPNRSTDMERESTDRLLKRYAESHDIALRNELVERHLYLAEIIAKKFVNRGIDYDDLFQVASLALIKAIERFDAEKGYRFSSFATPTIVGEIKNYFRDKSRTIRLPRRESEMMKLIASARETLSGELGRSPNADEIAAYLDIPVEQVLEILEISRSTLIASLDYMEENNGHGSLLSYVGSDEQNYEKIENMDFLRQAMEQCSDLERQIIEERFFREKSQREVADMIGVSQMYISRMEKKIITKFRHLLQAR
jgi:RNA polymerase sigma-B factor